MSIRLRNPGEKRRHMAALLGRSIEKTKWIERPEKYPGSVEDSCRVLNSVLKRRDAADVPHGLVHPRAEKFARGCREWRGDDTDPVKDVFDGGRYGFERLCRPAIKAGKTGQYG
jgi:hypothetical protein